MDSTYLRLQLISYRFLGKCKWELQNPVCWEGKVSTALYCDWVGHCGVSNSIYSHHNRNNLITPHYPQPLIECRVESSVAKSESALRRDFNPPTYYFFSTMLKAPYSLTGSDHFRRHLNLSLVVLTSIRGGSTEISFHYHTKL